MPSTLLATEAVVAHAKAVGSFFRKPIEELKVKLLLTGSAEDEMFPAGHYERLFTDICRRTDMAEWHVFEHGRHPAKAFFEMIRNLFA